MDFRAGNYLLGKFPFGEIVFLENYLLEIGAVKRHQSAAEILGSFRRASP